MGNTRTACTGNNERYTPHHILDMARDVFGGVIDLDPASSDAANKNVKANRYYTVETNGLLRAWSGNVWLNPPYSRDLIPLFISKLLHDYYSGAINQAIVLTHNNTEASWCQDLTGAATAICFPRGRIRFVDPDGSVPKGAPLQGQIITYLGHHPDKFREAFKSLGVVYYGVR